MTKPKEVTLIKLLLEPSNVRIIREALITAWKEYQDLLVKILKNLDKARDESQKQIFERLYTETKEIADKFINLDLWLQKELWKQFGKKLEKEAKNRKNPCEGCPHFSVCEDKDDEERRWSQCVLCPICFHELGEPREHASSNCDYCGWG